MPDESIGVESVSTGVDTGENVIERAAREQREALDELDALRNKVELLRAQVDLAHAILSSESLAWLFVGSNHPQAQWAAIKPAISAYWGKYGNYFRPKEQEGDRA